MKTPCPSVTQLTAVRAQQVRASSQNHQAVGSCQGLFNGVVGLNCVLDQVHRLHLNFLHASEAAHKLIDALSSLRNQMPGRVAPPRRELAQEVALRKDVLR